MTVNTLHQAVRNLRRGARLADGNGMTDGQLLQCFLVERDETAFEILLRRHGRMVLGVCQRILKNSGDAEDAFQATYLILLRKADSLLDRHTIGDWLYGVAQNTALKSRAASSRRRIKESQAAERAVRALPVEEIIWQEWRPLLDQEVQRLPAKYRTLIILCDLEQRSYQEAAALVGCSAGTVAGRLSRARDLLARRLTRYGVSLSVVALAALLAQNGAAASLPPPLVVATFNAATTLVAGGKLAAAGAISAPVAALSKGVLQAMWITNLKQILAVLALVVGMGMGTGAFLYQAVAAKPTAVQAKAGDGKVDPVEAEARAVIDRAVKAHGGDANLSKFKAVSVKWEGKHKIENFFWNATGVLTYQMPDKIRIDSEVQNPDGGKFSVSRVIHGAKGWQISATRVRDLKETQVAQILDDMYAPWLASLVPLKDKNFKFALVGQLTVDDKETMGVTVARKGRPDVVLYFDKKTGLLVKSERRAKDANGQEIAAEAIYRDHKAFQGVMWATKRFDKRDGADLEADSGKFEFSDFRAHDTLDEKLFVRP